jgi:hypothetical protein
VSGDYPYPYISEPAPLDEVPSFMPRLSRFSRILPMGVSSTWNVPFMIFPYHQALVNMWETFWRLT